MGDERAVADVAADNVAVTALVASVRQLGRAEGDVVAQIRHFGTTTRAITLEIDSAGRQVSRTTVTLGPDAVQTVHAHVPSLGADITARVDADDALAGLQPGQER